MPKWQPSQQRAIRTYPCPNCKQPMKMVGRESVDVLSTADLLTFQCNCGQVIATMMQ